MSDTGAKLVFLCGKIAAGKSTLARQLALNEKAILLVQDELLAHLFPNEIADIPGYVTGSARLRRALEAHICVLLGCGLSVVLDFPAFTQGQRAWFRGLIDRTRVEHELHFVDVPDELCKMQLRERRRDLPDGAAFTSEAEFDVITSFFQAPAEEEGFNVVLHKRVSQTDQSG